MSKALSKNNPIIIFAAIFAFAAFILKVLISVLSILFAPLVIVGLIAGIGLLSYVIYSNLYFNGKKFIEIKSDIKNYVDNFNELNNHINELKNSFSDIKSYDYGKGQFPPTP
jgi:cell shape-determining protein MreC